MRVSESLAFGYFLYLAIVCWLRPLSRRHRSEVAAVSVGMLVLICLLPTTASSSVRDWAPLAFILVGYYVPGRFDGTPWPAFEGWLMQWDRRVLGDPAARFATWPRPLVAYLDIVYMGVVVIVPGGFLVLALSGHADAADRYWTLVTGADFAAFVSLPLFQTRPPWALERTPELPSETVHRAALVFVRRGTIGTNTFPSGHTAVAFAIAFALLPVLPAAGLVALTLAVSIGLACIVGRYHYVIDVMTGVLLSVLVWAAASFIAF